MIAGKTTYKIEPSEAIKLAEGGEVVSASDEMYFNDYKRTQWLDKVISAEITEERDIVFLGLNNKGFVEIELRDMKALCFDYQKQVWIKKGVYVGCGHSVSQQESANCNCYGRLHEGEEAVITEHCH